MDQIQARSEDFKRGGGRDSEFVVSNATRPEWPRLRRDRVQGRGTMGNFPGGHKQGPKGRSIRAEARRAKAAGDGVQEKGCPLPLSKKIFYY